MTLPPTDLTGRIVHGDRVARRWWHTVRGVLAGRSRTAEPAEIAAAVARALTTGRRAVVVSARGGAGKSTVTVLLGETMATRRTDAVLVADADPDTGSLGWRLGFPAGPGLDLVASSLLAQDGAAAGHLPRTRAGLTYLPGGSAAPALARDVTRALSRRFAVCVTDCATVAEPATGAVLAEAHAVVVVCPATPDGVRSTCNLLDRVPPAARERVIVVLNAVGPHGALRARPARTALARYGSPVLELPYDRHLAGGATIDPSRLAEATVLAAGRLAAAVLDVARPL